VAARSRGVAGPGWSSAYGSGRLAQGSYRESVPGQIGRRRESTATATATLVRPCDRLLEIFAATSTVWTWPVSDRRA
jgi:hypothetical protein